MKTGNSAGRFQNSSAVRKNQRENALSGRENAGLFGTRGLRTGPFKKTLKVFPCSS